MTEGPTARLRAIQIWNKFGGHIVKEITAKSKKLHVDVNELINKRLENATSYGKNILLYFNGYIVRIHLMMYGSIRYKPEKPRQQIRLHIKFDNGSLFVYNAPIVEIGKAEQIEKELAEYGVDALFNWNEERLKNLIKKNGERKIGDLLLDQHVFAGIGNILRNEILFRAGVNPERFVKELKEDEIKRIITHVYELSHAFLKRKIEGKGIKDLLMVYNKKFCPICGRKLIFYRQHENKRKTFYCSYCQK